MIPRNLQPTLCTPGGSQCPRLVLASTPLLPSSLPPPITPFPLLSTSIAPPFPSSPPLLLALPSQPPSLAPTSAPSVTGSTTPSSPLTPSPPRCTILRPSPHWSLPLPLPLEAKAIPMNPILHGQSYFTNTLILPVINGPTEGLMIIYICHFFTGIVGAEWWAQPFGKSLPFLSWLPYLEGIPTFKAVLCLMIAFGVTPTVTCNVTNVYKVVKARNGSMPLALAMLYPFVVLVGGVLMWDYLSPSDIMGRYPHLVVIGTGLTFGYLVGRMILAHLCDEPKGLKTGMCMSLVYLPLAIANVLASRLNDGVPLLDERLVLLGYCAFSVALYLHFATSVIHEITNALGIYCFRITRKEA